MAKEIKSKISQADIKRWNDAVKRIKAEAKEESKIKTTHYTTVIVMRDENITRCDTKAVDTLFYAVTFIALALIFALLV